MTTTTTTDAAGNATRTTDYNGDGTADWIERDTQQDSEGRVTETRFDDDADGTADRVERYDYGTRTQANAGAISQSDVGRRIEVRFDDDYDGTAFRAARIERYGYDA